MKQKTPFPYCTLFGQILSLKRYRGDVQKRRTLLGKTHIKKCFLVVGPLRWGGGEVKPPEPLRNKNFVSIIKKKLPKPHEPLRSRGEGTLTLVVRPLRKPFFYVCLPLGKKTIKMRSVYDFIYCFPGRHFVKWGGGKALAEHSTKSTTLF